jgi:hypothetical protein
MHIEMHSFCTIFSSYKKSSKLHYNYIDHIYKTKQYYKYFSIAALKPN